MDFTWLTHFAYAIGALSFILRELFWLRCVSIVSSAGLITGTLLVQERWHATVFWHSLFITIHLTNIAITLYGEKSAHFDEREKELYETLFRPLTKLEFMKLLRAGAWLDAAPGIVLARQGEPVQDLMLISNGAAKVEIDARPVAELRDGQLVGEMSFITGGPATATVTATEPTQYLAWPKEKLHELLRRNPTMRYRLGTVLSTEVSRKLVSSSKRGEG